jgi:hypothetical protein
MQYNALPTSGQGFGVTPASFEGTNFETLTARSEINDDGSNSLLAHRLDESVEIADTADLNREKRSEQGNLKPALKLFQGQGEFVKAIIYSEILAPRSQSRRSAK